MSRGISIVFSMMKTPSRNGTMKLRQTSRIQYWKVQGECMFFSDVLNDVNLTVICSRFLLASLQIEELQDCYNEDGLKDQLQGLPRNLDQVYDRIISGLNERHREDALKIMQWLSFSARPLKLAEVAQVIGVVPDADQGLRFTPSRVSSNSRSVLMMCSSLATETNGE